MNINDATEVSYKNGYDKCKEDCIKILKAVGADMHRFDFFMFATLKNIISDIKRLEP